MPHSPNTMRAPQRACRPGPRKAPAAGAHSSSGKAAMPIATGTAIISANRNWRMVTATNRRCRTGDCRSRSPNSELVMSARCSPAATALPAQSGTAPECDRSDDRRPAARAREPKTLVAPSTTAAKAGWAISIPASACGWTPSNYARRWRRRSAEARPGVIVNALRQFTTGDSRDGVDRGRQLAFEGSPEPGCTVSVSPGLPIAAVRRARVAGATSASGVL